MPDTIYVNPEVGNDTANGSQQAPLKTITQALKKATSGTQIQLADGTYNAANGEAFPLSVPSGVSIIGNEVNKGSSILIEGSGEYLSRTFARQNVIFVLANGAQLRGVTVTNSAIRGSGVWIESTSPTVANCTFRQCKREGVFVTGEANPVIRDNQFTENVANGMAIAKNAQGDIRGNTCFNTGFGIAISDSASPKLTDNKIYENRSGIVISGDARPVLRNNLCEKNIQDGLTVIVNALPDIGSTNNPGGNIFRNNGQFDIQNATSNKLVSVGNQIDPAKAKGSIEFTENQVPTPILTPSPNPTPTPTPEPEPIPEPILTPIPTPTPIPSVSDLTDIKGHWAATFIQELVKLDIIKGFPDRTFKPDATMTRAQYAALLVKAFNPSAKRQVIKFKDVAENFWAYKVIEQAYQGQFLSGYPDSTFHPNENIQRVQVIVSLVNGLGLTTSANKAVKPYDDQAKIPNYAKDEVVTATQKQIIVNYPKLNLLNPTREATRAEVAAMVYQALVDAGRVATIDLPYIVAA
ncbi:DUF1565 domain-containing protein [Chlorogloeopsis fritschii PCC 9212]|uniref:SLH domain-containing protein n=1 Tax=Chlorogloeopsis fritschii PCC 6912 TaxID=211165 RepID=A0A433N3G9_CHLFR|nr:DUF1565 domain-containing protein [Chlorogloeopsis fritschii]RUR75717.1 hypothetical protein PCC6912_46140 [Chlorogloeopsis fritschii PCC 6912]